MKAHARNGFDLLDGSGSSVLQAGAEIALAHHEKFDGSGYPAGLAGEAIPLFGRIVAVADVFDALISERPYKRAWAVDDARRFLLDNAGRHFDPACVQAFVAAWDEVLQVRESFRDIDEPLI
jgi:response regulator RpfG family c-di-GMP phosphodiesterase